MLQLNGGADAKYLVVVNDSHVKNQADRHQVTETLLPAETLPAGTALYDCTEERALGGLKPILCDLTQTTARVYAVLPRALAATLLTATQKLAAGNLLQLRVEFRDAAKKRLAAVLPFHLAVQRPDGTTFQECYRATTRDGVFTLALQLPVNVPAGVWTVAVARSSPARSARCPSR